MSGSLSAALIPLLHQHQKQHGYISKESMKDFAAKLGVSPGQVESTATFYSMFRFEPENRHSVDICTGISCMLRGSDDLLAQTSKLIGEPVNGFKATHSTDGEWSVREVECLGACSCAPVVAVDGEYYEDAVPADMKKLLQSYKKGRPPVPGSLRKREIGEMKPRTALKK